jgi:NADH-quinone oxidoreductase subunit M
MTGFLNDYILTILIFFPIAGALLVSVLPRSISRQAAVAVSVIELLLSLHLWAHWGSAPRDEAGYRFAQNSLWIPEFGINYHLGVDGISVMLILLTTFLTPVCLLAAWTDISQHTKEFAVCFLLLVAVIIGVFTALDLILFFIFWEASLVPMYLLIGVWGGARRIYASVKFFLYTMIGSVLMWTAMLYVYFQQPEGTRSFDLMNFGEAARRIQTQSPETALWLFAAFALAFSIKIPLFPFHTWLPDAHTEAPTAGSVDLAAVLLKTGAYGFVRFAIPFFPDAARAFAPIMIVLSLLGIVYGALVCTMQTDFKRVIAYSSVSHVGFVMLGIFAALGAGRYGDLAMTGATLQMVNHGITSAALFLLVGILYERRHTRELSQFGGIGQVMPRYMVLFWIATFASVGLPGLNAFVGEYLILQGVANAQFWYAAVAATGVILGAIYMLRTVRRVMFGEITREENRALKDVNPREMFVVGSVLAFAVWIGLYPKPILDIIYPDAATVVTKQFNAGLSPDGNVAANKWARR